MYELTVRYHSSIILTIISMHPLSLIAPQHPTNPTIITMTPTAMQRLAAFRNGILGSKVAKPPLLTFRVIPNARMPHPEIWRKDSKCHILYRIIDWHYKPQTTNRLRFFKIKWILAYTHVYLMNLKYDSAFALLISWCPSTDLYNC